MDKLLAFCWLGVGKAQALWNIIIYRLQVIEQGTKESCFALDLKSGRVGYSGVRCPAGFVQFLEFFEVQRSVSDHSRVNFGIKFKYVAVVCCCFRVNELVCFTLEKFRGRCFFAHDLLEIVQFTLRCRCHSTNPGHGRHAQLYSTLMMTLREGVNLHTCRFNFHLECLG